MLHLTLALVNQTNYYRCSGHIYRSLRHTNAKEGGNQLGRLNEKTKISPFLNQSFCSADNTQRETKANNVCVSMVTMTLLLDTWIYH